jgi:hypothetical protein
MTHCPSEKLSLAPFSVSAAGAAAAGPEGVPAGAAAAFRACADPAAVAAWVPLAGGAVDFGFACHGDAVLG